MRSSAVLVATTVLVSLLAASQSRYYEAPTEVVPYSIVDQIVKAILESIRPQLANLRIDDIDQEINHPNLNATFRVKDILVKNTDKFQIKALKSSVVPLRLTNLTLTWDEIVATAAYDVNVTAASSQQGPFSVFGKGDARAALRDIYFTIGANIELKDKAIQVKPKGFFGFDLIIKSANVTLTSLMGSSELGTAVGTFIGKIIPDLVNTLKKPLFDAFHDDIVKFVNQVLKKNGTSFAMNEEPALPEFSFESLDLSQELDTFFRQPLALPSEELPFEDDF